MTMILRSMGRSATVDFLPVPKSSAGRVATPIRSASRGSDARANRVGRRAHDGTAKCLAKGGAAYAECLSAVPRRRRNGTSRVASAALPTVHSDAGRPRRGVASSRRLGRISSKTLL